jgi:hypothetical protein
MLPAVCPLAKLKVVELVPLLLTTEVALPWIVVVAAELPTLTVVLLVVPRFTVPAPTVLSMRVPVPGACTVKPVLAVLAEIIGLAPVNVSPVLVRVLPLNVPPEIVAPFMVLLVEIVVMPVSAPAVETFSPLLATWNVLPALPRFRPEALAVPILSTDGPP